MQRLSNQFFSGAAFTLQKNCGTAGSNLRHKVENLEHGLALAHDIFEVVPPLQRSLQLNVFFFGATPANCSAHIGQQLLVIPGFLQKIRSPGLHRTNCILNGAIGRDHDHRDLRIDGANFGQNIQPAAAGKCKIQ